MLTRYSCLYVVVLMIAGLVLGGGAGCILQSDSFAPPLEDVFTGGCFEHLDGREEGYLLFFSMERAHNINGMAFGCSRLGTPNDFWTFFGEATSPADERYLTANLTAFWLTEEGEYEELSLEGFFDLVSEELTLRGEEGSGQVVLTKESCGP